MKTTIFWLFEIDDRKHLNFYCTKVVQLPFVPAPGVKLELATPEDRAVLTVKCKSITFDVTTGFLVIWCDSCRVTLDQNPWEISDYLVARGWESTLAPRSEG